MRFWEFRKMMRERGWWGVRIGVWMALTVAVVLAALVGVVMLICSAVESHQAEVRKREARERDRIKWEQIQATHERNLREEQERLSRIERAQRVTLDTARGNKEVVKEKEKEKEKYSWWHLEDMVRKLSTEGYYSVMWKVQDGSSAWIVLYKKGGHDYIRRIDPEKDTYGKATRLVQHDLGEFYVYGNRKRWYKYDNHLELIYEVNGVEKERFVDFHQVDLFTDDYDDDDDDDSDDYIDLYYHYGGKPA